LFYWWTRQASATAGESKASMIWPSETVALHHSPRATPPSPGICLRRLQASGRLVFIGACTECPGGWCLRGRIHCTTDRAAPAETFFFLFFLLCRALQKGELERRLVLSVILHFICEIY
jgi:hypothetical protein